MDYEESMEEETSETRLRQKDDEGNYLSETEIHSKLIASIDKDFSDLDSSDNRNQNIQNDYYKNNYEKAKSGHRM